MKKNRVNELCDILNKMSDKYVSPAQHMLLFELLEHVPEDKWKGALDRMSKLFLVKSDSNQIVEKIWIRECTELGTDNYSVSNEQEARIQIEKSITENIGYVVEKNIADSIIEKLKTDDWPDALTLFNKHNAMHHHYTIIKESK